MAKARSTVRDQKDALRVLGVLKVATATQILNLVRPHLTDNKVIRNALLDLEAAGEVVSEGNTAGPSGRFGAPDRTGEPSQKLWGLTLAGLDAAGRLLERGPEEMGGRARGAGRGGAPHAMGVNATIIAFTEGGIGDISSWRTEVPHALASSGKQNVRADAVLRAKEAGLPLLMLEMDMNTEPVQRVADKLAAYAACYRRHVNDPAALGTWTSRRAREAGSVAYWETLYPGTGLSGWPPLAFVFTGAGPRALANRMQTLGELTREHWAAEERQYVGGDGYLDFTGRVPLVLTTLELLQQHGPQGPVWRRVAQQRGEFEPLLTALTDIRTKVAFEHRQRQRRAAEQARHEAERAAQQAAQRARLQQWAQKEAAEAEAEAVRPCATADCELAVDTPVDWYTDMEVPPEDGIYCGPCRLNQAARNRGLRGVLRRMRNDS
ncbi:replication-relaxation family protein [Streptomyces sp. RKAG293]|uniref:replication-relaxation family protein n=1 Tax=Streptomyces sp. RKAG293 TaxID=2893403 RepID=UPI00203345CA|nr:replication-relaxation family protein [Streptomyces sp. RKAG293]MCM2424255.1 replication-relaxation family protein [Streptomyces sp. RKAG293]